MADRDPDTPDRLLDDTARYLTVEHRHAGRHDHHAANLACYGCALLARIEQHTAGPDSGDPWPELPNPKEQQ